MPERGLDLCGVHEEHSVPVAFPDPIPVTRPYLPPYADFVRGLEEIWTSRQLSNNGPIVVRLANALSNYLGTPNISVLGNGTLALEIGLKVLGLRGDVITTPYTFPATVHALVASGLRPVFVDIESTYYTLNPDLVEAAITPNTAAVLGVHLYGHPCRHDVLLDICERHGLRLIYDAAHAFGVNWHGVSIAALGDISMFSLHATKQLHAMEGGVLVCREQAKMEAANLFKNFGFTAEGDVVVAGTNAKMTEMQALMGLLVLERIGDLAEHRRRLYNRYRSHIERIPGLSMPPEFPGEIEYNFAFVPVRVEEERFGIGAGSLQEALRDYNVWGRRYFYPLVPDLACYRGTLERGRIPVASRVSEQMLCLPLFHDLQMEDVDRICEMVARPR